jgi:hypothetical protein
VSVGLGLGLAHERSRSVELERALGMVRVSPPSHYVAAPRPEPSPPIEIAPDSYLALSRRLVAGLDGPPPGPPAPPGRPVPDRSPSPLRVRGSEGLRDL